MSVTAARTDHPPQLQVLSTGWEPDTPVSDTLLRRFVFNLASCWEAPAQAARGHVIRTDAFAIADLGRPAGLFNGATLLQPLPPGDTARTAAVLDEIETALGVDDPDRSGTVMLWSAWPTPDLRARGWTLEGHPPFLVRPPGPLPQPSRHSDLRVAAVADGEALREFEQVAIDGYPFTDMQPYRPRSLFAEGLLDDDRMRLVTGHAPELGRAVTIGGLCVEAGLAGFMLGVTLPETRGRGAWAAMVRARLLAAPDLPAAGLFSDMSRPGAQHKFGFLPVSRFTLWSRARKPAESALTGLPRTL